jgi:hypothetical protein
MRRDSQIVLHSFNLNEGIKSLFESKSKIGLVSQNSISRVGNAS